MKIYHNPRCSKSRETLYILEQNGANPEIVEYLKTPPTEEELRSILKKLDMKPFDIVRRGEELYINNYKGKTVSDDEWIKVLAAHPILIERPIVVKGNKAVLGRPPENVYDIM